ncbi:hypothetical protein F5X96DRAFT_682182 [Biscogniauxia mediterranea]|nr:hypothetical protein F5X96DRAFT_682182 [Biscogniauxia mediterranea]
MSPDVRIHTYTEPPAYLPALLTAHLPHSLPLLRRLQFTRFPGGITPHARIFVATTSSSSPTATEEEEEEKAAEEPPNPVAQPGQAFAAAYVDLSRGPETQVWLYSSLEHRSASSPPSFSSSSSSPDESSSFPEEQEIECARALLGAVKRWREDGGGGGGGAARGPDDHHDTVMLGTLSERLRRALDDRAGLVFPYTEVYDKWLFRLADLPPAAEGQARVDERLAAAAAARKKIGGGAGGSGAGWRWDGVRREDIPLVLSRTHIPRKERTVKLLPSTAIYLDDGTPIAWSFLGPDSSLSSLHCEKQYRGKGLAKAVAVKLLRDHLKDYGDEEYGWADVAPDNLQSQGVCKSLGGKIGWQVSWSRIDLDLSFPDS